MFSKVFLFAFCSLKNKWFTLITLDCLLPCIRTAFVIRCLFQKIFDRFGIIWLFQYRNETLSQHVLQEEFCGIYMYLLVLVAFAVLLVVCLDLWAGIWSSDICNIIRNSFSVAFGFMHFNPFVPNALFPYPLKKSVQS